LVDGRTKRRKNREADEAGVGKRRYIFYDYERARACIQQNYFGPDPSFGPDDFKKMFRVSRVSLE
jgi:hypothetical protein